MPLTSLDFLPISTMGNSSSKQQTEGVSPEAEQEAASTSLDNDQVKSEQPPSGDAMQQDDTRQLGSAVKEEEFEHTLESAAAATTQDGGDSFKVPSLPTTAAEAPLSPNSTSLKALPADIEHILSLGANQDELSKLENAKASGSGAGEIDHVVRELREKYKQEGTEVAGAEGTELSQVEKEMKEKGILRNEGNVKRADEKMDEE